MRRGWKILLAIVVALVALLAINMLIVDGQTKDAEVTVDGGEIVSLPGGDVQVIDSGEPAAADAGAPIVLIHCFGCSLHWWDAMLPLLSEEHRVIRDRPARPRRLREAEERIRDRRSGGTRGGRARPFGRSGRGCRRPLARRSGRGGPGRGASELVDRVVLINEAPDTSYGELDFLAKLTAAPVIGEALWRVKVGSLIKSGYEQAFAPDFDIDSGFTDPDQVVADNKAMTFTSYTESKDAAEEIHRRDAARSADASDAHSADGDLRHRGPDL